MAHGDRVVVEEGGVKHFVAQVRGVRFYLAACKTGDGGADDGGVGVVGGLTVEVDDGDCEGGEVLLDVEEGCPV